MTPAEIRAIVLNVRQALLAANNQLVQYPGNRSILDAARKTIEQARDDLDDLVAAMT